MVKHFKVQSFSAEDHAEEMVRVEREEDVREEADMPRSLQVLSAEIREGRQPGLQFKILSN